MGQPVWFEVSKKVHLGGVGAFKADKLRIGLECFSSMCASPVQLLLKVGVEACDRWPRGLASPFLSGRGFHCILETS